MLTLWTLKILISRGNVQPSVTPLLWLSFWFETWENFAQCV